MAFVKNPVQKEKSQEEEEEEEEEEVEEEEEEEINRPVFLAHAKLMIKKKKSKNMKQELIFLLYLSAAWV